MSNIKLNCGITVIIKHKVQKEKGIVVAITSYDVTDLAYMALNKVIDGIGNKIEGIIFTNKFTADFLTLPKTISAVAKCHESDTFDSKEGIKIADVKLKKKLDGMIAKRMKHVAMQLEAAQNHILLLTMLGPIQKEHPKD